MLSISSSISKKLGFSVVLLFLLNIFTVVSFFFIFYQQKSYAPAINDSGRLRMLSQRASKDVFLISEGYNQEKEDLVLVTNEFTTTLNNLISGNKSRGIVVPSETINEQLSKVNDIWKDIDSNIKIIVSSNDNTNDKFKQSVSYIRKNNMSLLSEANKTVGMYEEESANKQNTLVLVIASSISILALIILIIVISITRKIVNSLVELTRATKTISRFSLVSNINVNSNDEIGELAKNFNLMVENMRNSMENNQ